ncbi:MAG: hypothetical protein BGP06_02155 [Rhizobiales bacterium 65-9]|nr:Hpt domain-containing protein [Hyphomicrobiales bacterium]OJY34284.1 MAG: hypothetical protein BGP06_02155 [Rhizobiales bacterium 65-9]
MADISPPAATSVREPIDFDHLARQTMGDADLQAEVLGLFRDQAARLLTALQATTPADRAARDLAHTMIGAARGIGAFAVADIAARVEAASADDFAAAIADLSGAVADAHAAIGRRLAQA